MPIVGPEFRVNNMGRMENPRQTRTKNPNSIIRISRYMPRPLAGEEDHLKRVMAYQCKVRTHVKQETRNKHDADLFWRFLSSHCDRSRKRIGLTCWAASSKQHRQTMSTLRRSSRLPGLGRRRGWRGRASLRCLSCGAAALWRCVLRWLRGDGRVRPLHHAC